MRKIVAMVDEAEEVALEKEEGLMVRGKVGKLLLVFKIDINADINL